MSKYPMESHVNFTRRWTKLTSILLWLLAIILTLVCFMYQDKTGPTYPLEGDFQTAKGPIHFKFLRSETIGTDLALMLLDEIPEGVTGYVEYRRYQSDDELSTIPFEPGQFEFSRRGRAETVQAIGAKLPSLTERAGKYEFRVYIDDGSDQPVSIAGTEPIYARYKAAVPYWVLFIHIFTIFASMTFSLRTTFEALIDGNFKWMIWASIISLLLGGFLFGPLVQFYAFGVLWSGVPFGYDWTDNKVLVEMIFWLIAAFLNWGKKRNRLSVILAGVVTLLVYFIPHSLFGSEFNYRTGIGTGTADRIP
ncbi:MAG: hypothetical protein GY869_16690 [Planctomycetes bacterium]|nr:hypothetical protein [Planctomycetota bacterium]